MSSAARIAEFDQKVPDDVARWLGTVSQWFAQPESNEEYIDAAGSMETWTVRVGLAAAGRDRALG